MDKLKYIKIEDEDGNLSDNIPIGADAKNIDTSSGLTAEEELSLIKDENKTQKEQIEALQNQIKASTNGSPLAADSISEMTDTSRIYVNTTDGHWYYYNNSSWNDGGVYQAAEIADGSIDSIHLSNDILSYNYINQDSKIEPLGAGYIKDNFDFGSSSYLYKYKVKCNPYEKIKFNINTSSLFYAIVFYNSNDQAIIGKKFSQSSSKVDVEVFTPRNTAYAILVSYYSSFTGIEVSKKNIIVNKTDTNFEESIDAIDEALKCLENTELSANATERCYVNYANGNISVLAGELASDFLEVQPNSKLRLLATKNLLAASSPDLRGLAFYNSDKKFVSGIQYKPEMQNRLDIFVPEKAEYFRFTMHRGYEYQLVFMGLEEVIDWKINDKVNKLFKKNNNPLDEIISDGGLMNIFQKVACFGDSLTAGQFEANNTGTTTYNTKSDYGYPKHLQRILNNTVKSFAQGGFTPKSWFNKFKDTAFIDDNLCECYIIALGTNDIGYNGSFSGDVSADINLQDYNNNADSSVGYYARIIQLIKKYQPKAKIFCSGIPHTRNSLATRTEANQKISAICDLFENVYFMDFQTYGVQPDDLANYKSIYYMGGHRSSQGYYQLAKEYSTYIDYIIRNNPKDFNQIPFIGTELSRT